MYATLIISRFRLKNMDRPIIRAMSNELKAGGPVVAANIDKGLALFV